MHVMIQTNHKKTGAVMLVFALAFCLFMLPVKSNAGGKSERVSQGMSKPELRDHDRHERASKSSRRLLEAHEHGEDITPQLDALDADSAEIEKEEQEHLKRFEQTGRKLRTIAGISTVVSRHEQALRQFRQKSGELKEHFHKIRKAKRDKATPAEITGRVKELSDYLEKHRPRKEYDIKSTGNGLPWRMVQPGDLQILGDISQASQQGLPPAAATPVSGDDLSATIDVQITPEIQVLASSLHNSPLEIFRHVYNNYDYTPYHGSMKGSLDVFWEKEGNDYDLATLLIALLRASNVPARYVRAEIIVPIRNIQAWLGIDDPLAAAQYLAGAKIPCSFYTSGASISHVQLEHIYVEAFIPYGNYRGTGEDDKGKAWVPMDPSFKKYAVTQSGIDFGTAMAFDWKSFSSDYLGTLQNITPLDHYKNRINDYIATNQSGKTIDELKRKSELAKMKFDFLPNTLPYKTYNIIERYSAIPSNQRHTIRFTIPDVLDYTTALPEISGRRITLTFSGATAEDQTAIDSYGGIFKTPPYLIKVMPILRIGGTQVAQGSALDAGTMTPFSVTHSHPDGKQDPFSHNVMTGSHNAIGLTTGKVRPEYLSIAEVEPSDEVYLPKMLHSLVMKYHNALSETRRTLNETMRMQSHTFLTEALVSTNEERTLVLGGIPTTFSLDGFKIDAKEVSMAALPVDGKDINKKQIDFAMTFGHEASYQENRVFEDNMFWVEGTSAVKGLQMLNAFGIQLDELEPHTTYANANLPTGVVEDINNALNMGWRVIAPQETGGLQAIPYIKYDDKTGSAGFMLAASAGGLANEIIDMTWVKDFWVKDNIRMTYEILYPQSPYLVAMGDAFEIIMKATAEYVSGLSATAYNKVLLAGLGGYDGVLARADSQSNTIIDTNWNNFKKGIWPMYSVIPGSYKYLYNGKELFKFNVWNVMVKQSKNAVSINNDATGDPVMPSLILNSDIIGATFDQIDKNELQICWSGKLEYNVNTKAAPYRSRKGLDPSGAGQGKDGFYIPVAESPNSPYLPSKPDCRSATLDYIVDWKTMFGGGKLTITTQVKYAGRNLTPITNNQVLRIEGELASTTTAKAPMINYLKQAAQKGSPSLEDILGSKDVLFALACIESYGANHFWPSINGDPKKAMYPTENSIGDGGFGIMQLTNGGSLPQKVEIDWVYEDGTRKPAPPEFVPSYEQIWNWKKNVDASIGIVQEKINAAKQWPNYSNRKKGINNKMCPSFSKYQTRMETYSLFRGGHYWKCNYNIDSEEYKWIPRFDKNSDIEDEVDNYNKTGVSEADKAFNNENKNICQ